MRLRKRVLAFACPALVLSLAAVSDLSAQTATALVREGEVLGAAGAVNSINGPGVNHIGGFSVQLNTNNGTTTLSHIWGNATGGPGAIIISEGTIGPWQISAYETFHGFNDRGEPCYGVTAANTDTGLTGLDGVFVDQTLVLIEREPVPTMPGFYSTFNSRPGCTSGEPWWVGGITNVPNSSTTQNRVLFYGIAATPVFKGGDLVGGVGLPQSMSTTLDFSARFSRLGTHYTFEAQVTGATTATDQMMTLDGNVMVAGGGHIREGSPIPAAAGGLPGENWAAASFEEKGVTEDGRVLFTGDTSATTTVDDIVFFDGQVVLREGTVFAGPGGNYTISGAIESGSLNRQGDWAVTWDVNPPSGANREALFVNGVMVLQENDLVDLTGDGIPDANGILRDFGGATTMVIGPRNAHGEVAVYFTADIDVNNTPTSSTDDVEALFRLDVLSGVPNRLPVAACQDVQVKAEDCASGADADVNDGSSDPDDDPFTLTQSPAGPYPFGQTNVVLTIRDIQGATDTCNAVVTVLSSCDDENPCTTDTCTPEGCVHEPIVCDDGNACTADSCDPASGCVYQEISCDDGNACTIDSCDPASGCTYGDVVCDDENACTTDSCDPASGCLYDPIVCDDGVACTVDTCDASTGCTYTPNDGICNDGNFCTVDACLAGSGCAYQPVTCAPDGDACTSDACDPAAGCTYPEITAEEPNPRTIGWWKGLCQGPHSGDELLEVDAACVASRGTTFTGVTSLADICAVLLQGGQGGTCAQTEIDLMSLALNQCHVRVCGANPIDSQYSDNGTVSQSYTEADAILSDPDRNHQSCMVAKGLLEEINTGRALNLDTTAFAKTTGGGVRVTWQVPYGMDPVKYNVWRRRAGSLAAFAKIGETTTPVFDDATPGSFEYDVTPVR